MAKMNDVRRARRGRPLGSKTRPAPAPKPQPDSADVMTASEAAVRLGIGRRTIDRWTRDGFLTAIRTAPLLYETAEIERIAAELLEEARAKVAHLASEAAS